MKFMKWVIAEIVLIYQSVLLGISQIWANKTRSILTTIGIVIGVASVTAVIAGLTGLRAKVLADFEKVGANMIFIFPNNPYRGTGKVISWEKIRFKLQEFDRLMEHCPSVAVMGRSFQTSTNVSYGQKSMDDAVMCAIDPGWHQIEQRSVQIGRPFSLLDAQECRHVCLVSEEVRDKLGLNKDPTDKSIVIDNMSYRIVGVVDPPVKMEMFGGNEVPKEVFIPFTTAMRKYPWRSFFVKVLAKSPPVAPEAKAEISFYLRRVRHLKPDDPETFRVEAVQQYVDQFNSIAFVITAVAGGIVGISLLVGGVGIMNIMLVSVSERTREIGLRKAVGARPSALLLQFLVEAVTLCIMGGLVGIGIGQMLTWVISHIPHAQLEHAHIPMWAILLSLCFCTAVGLVFGMWPAIKAARMDPIEALRHE